MRLALSLCSGLHYMMMNTQLVSGSTRRFNRNGITGLHALLLSVLLSLATGTGRSESVTNSLAIHNSNQWKRETAAFDAKDRTNPPPPGCIVFVGSSSIRFWTTLAADFPGFPVINRGFGGSQLADSVNFANRIITAYHPREVVI
jgi:hypothetical protein